MGASGGFFSASWGPLRALSGCLGSLLRRFRPSWAPPGPSWGRLRPSWAALGAVWRVSWAVLGASGAVLGPSWAVLGPSWGHLGAILGARVAVVDASETESPRMPKMSVFRREWDDFCLLGLSGGVVLGRRGSLLAWLGGLWSCLGAPWACSEAVLAPPGASPSGPEAVRSRLGASGAAPRSLRGLREASPDRFYALECLAFSHALPPAM